MMSRKSLNPFEFFYVDDEEGVKIVHQNFHQRGSKIFHLSIFISASKVSIPSEKSETSICRNFTIFNKSKMWENFLKTNFLELRSSIHYSYFDPLEKSILCMERKLIFLKFFCLTIWKSFSKYYFLMIQIILL